MISGRHKEYRYDHLVVALGSVSRVVPIPGLVEHAIGFKTIAEATALRNRIVRHFELAEGLDDKQARAEYLSFVFVGGGYAGLEGIAELAGLRPRRDQALPALPRDRHALHADRRRAADHAGDPAAAGRLHGRAADQARHRVPALRRPSPRCVTTAVVLSDRRDDQGPHRRLDRGRAAQARSPRDLGLPLEHGRIVCDEYMRVRGLREHLGARRHRRGARPGSPGQAVPADRAARDPPGQAARQEHRRA